MTAIERRDFLNSRTGLRWSAGDGVHVAYIGALTYRLRQIDDDLWHAMVLDSFVHTPRAQFRGSVADCAEWCAQILIGAVT